MGEDILDYLAEHKGSSVKVGNIVIGYQATKEDTVSGRRQIFIIERIVDDRV